MAAQNWMIGDWYQWYAECRYYPYQVKPEDFTKDYIANFEPIPLTPEILEKNGWDTSPYSILKVCNDKWLEFYHHERRLRLWWKGIDEWQNHAEVQEVCFQCNCTYVHELQHALRLCGLTDIADNFKID